MAARPKRGRTQGDAPIEDTSTRSGGVNIDAESVKIGGDVVGRDKIVYTGAQRDRNLRILLEKVRTFWVKGVLENSVHEAVLIELGKQVQIDVVDVDYPWERVVRIVDQPDRTLPSHQKVVNIFNDMEQALLILGEPGSGKTTTLLELARDLIAQVEQDPTLPIPVVFNLSAWAERRPTLAEWLVLELKTKYGVPSKMGRKWIEHNNLTLLLDGLDEVNAEHRSACLNAINEFRLEHGLTGVVVCSRTREYRELTNRLKLKGAILIQPLTREQIDRSILAAGPQLATLRHALQTDLALQELAQSPLMLSIMSWAYSSLSSDDVASGWSDLTQRRHQLFEAYVGKMFARTARTQPELYPRQQTVGWLAWLAQRMSEHSQTVFLIEQMQPSWLRTRAQRWWYAMGSMLFAGLLVGLLGGLPAGLESGLLDGLRIGLVLGTIAALIFGSRWSILTIREPKDIAPVESLKWSWTRASSWLIRVIAIAGPLVLLCSDPTTGLLVRLNTVLFLGLFAGLFGGLIRGSLEESTKPNQGIWQSGRNALLIVLLVGLLFSLISLLSLIPPLTEWQRTGSLDRLLERLLYNLSIGLMFGSIAWLFYGGYAFGQHFSLRLILYRGGHLPWNYARFLDYSAERIFLRKVGGGYIFIHRLLMEYFASLEPDRPTQSV